MAELRIPPPPPERIRITHPPAPAATVRVANPFQKKDEAKVYYHSGNLGDIVYALYAIQKVGGGQLILGPEQNRTARADNPIDEARYTLLKPLLDLQPYIPKHSFSFHYRGNRAFDLNQFRNHWNNQGLRWETGINLLAWMHCYALKVHDEFRHDETWVNVGDPIKTDRIIIHRSFRYRNDLFNWQVILKHFGSGNLLFVGLPEEHQEFTASYSCNVEYRPVTDYLELARVIAGGKGFIGNQSFPCALAIGVGQRVIQEAWPNSPDCLFLRSNLIGYVSGPFFTTEQLEKWSMSELQPAVFHVEQEKPQEVPPNAPVISVLCHNRLELTRRCLQMLVRNSPPCRIIVTNNASSDGTREWLEDFAKDKPNIRLVHNTENLGYKDPHNNAWVMAKELPDRPRIFCILNNDLEIGPGWWDRIEAAFAADPSMAIVGSSSGVCSQLNGQFEGAPGLPNQSPEYVEGSLLAIRMDVADQIGLFDPNLQFIYGEDSDLSLRARESGYNIATIDVNCRHLSSQTVRYLDPATKAKISKAKEDNHRWLVNRWGVYLRRRNFNYQVLINREGAVGDLIMATPALAALKKKWPLSDIYVRTVCPQVFTNSPVVKAAAPNLKGPLDYNFELNLSYEAQPMEHPVLVYARTLGVNVDLETAEFSLYATKEDQRLVKAYLPPVDDGKPLAVVHPGPTNWIGRDWMKERWDSVISWMSSQGWHVIVIGTPWEFSECAQIKERTSLQVLYCLMQRASIFVGVDSGPFHVAQAAKIPCVALFGTIYPHLRVLPSVPVIAVQADQAAVPCVGEHHRLPPPVQFSACTGACMQAITVEMVKDAINQMVF